MAAYTLEEKESFIVAGIGTELKSEDTDYAGVITEASLQEEHGVIQFPKVVSGN